jgi:hypothetical protein
MSREQAERFKTVFERYNEWKRLRILSSERGAAVRHELWPVIRRFHNLFPVNIADFRFDGIATVGNLYTLLCAALKLEPLIRPDKDNGTVRQPCRAVPQADMSMLAREFGAWRGAVWTAEGVWATLVSNIVDGYGLDPSTAKRQMTSGISTVSRLNQSRSVDQQLGSLYCPLTLGFGNFILGRR